MTNLAKPASHVKIITYDGKIYLQGDTLLQRAEEKDKRLRRSPR